MKIFTPTQARQILDARQNLDGAAILSRSPEIREAVEAAHGPEAVQAMIEFRSRQDRTSHPEGSFGSAGRFFLSEDCPTCKTIRRPSRAWPHSEMLHGRTLEHVAGMMDLNPEDVRSAGYAAIREHITRRAEAQAA